MLFRSYSSSSSQTLGGTVSGDGSIEKDTSTTSTLTLSGNNTYAGGTTVSSGTLKAGSGSGITGPPFGTGSVIVSATNATLDLNGQSISNLLTLNGTGLSSAGAIINSNATAATASGNITLGSNTSIGGANAITLSGIIDDGVNTYAITKVGAGTTTLTGANTYSGNTTISAGTLVLSGSGTLGNNTDRKSTRLNSSHTDISRMPSSA